nr:hypothetical protein [Tanacetum cinerariifolium]
APKCQTMALEHDILSPGRKCQENVSHGDKTDTTSNELDFLFSPMFDELLNGSSKVVSKSSAVSAADAPLNNHTTPVPTCQNPPITTSVISSENINQAEPHAENDEVADDEFINIFSTPVQDQGEMSSRHEITCSCFHGFINKDLINLVIPDVRRYVVVVIGIYYHLKELRYCAQCLIEDEDFIKRSRSTLGEEV